MKNNPETRFQEFSEAWNTALIEDCFIERKERSGDGEMISVTINTGIRKAKELDRTVHIGDTSNYKVVRQGDIAYNSMRMWQGASGYSPYDGILSPAYTVIIPKQDIISEFFASLFKQPELIHTFELNSQGLTSDTWNLKFEKLKKITVSYPSSPEEQHKIAQFFSRLDSLINAEDKKLERLKKIKSASLEKMFPKQGETVPEVRFKRFTGEWMESRIGDCFSERKERSGIGEMLSVTINSGVRKARELDRTVHIGDTSNYKVVRQGDIAYNSMRMWQGASGYSQYDGIVSPAYTVIIPKERIDSRFFACLFKTQHMIHVFELNSQGLTSDTWNLKYGQLRSIPVKYPVDLKEQIYIAEFFSRLDSLISAQEQKSAELRSLKKSFLEKMFVSTPK